MVLVIDNLVVRKGVSREGWAQATVVAHTARRFSFEGAISTKHIAPSQGKGDAPENRRLIVGLLKSNSYFYIPFSIIILCSILKKLPLSVPD